MIQREKWGFQMEGQGKTVENKFSKRKVQTNPAKAAIEENMLANTALLLDANN